MGESPSQAVFISYASEDAEAAGRLTAALTQAGIDVWLDRSELRGGDSWDQNIRRRIRECALFIPIISQTTERRSEGYFRLEWRLADQRTHLMGRSKAFIVPVCLDPIDQDGADVPESFVAAQWTHLPEGNATPEFVLRVRTLLDYDPSDPGRTRAPFTFRPPAPPPTEPVVTAPARRSRTAFAAVALAVVVAGGGFYYWHNASEAAAAEQNLERSIAILPFRDNSDTPSNIAERIQENVIARLNYLAGVRALPSLNVEQYRNNPKTIGEIAGEVGVNYVVTGAVARENGKVRFTGGLYRAANEALLKPLEFVQDDGEVQTFLASAIAEQLQTTLSEHEKSLLNRKATENADARSLYESVSRTFGVDLPTRAWLDEQEQKLEEAVANDENYETAWALLSTVYSLQIFTQNDTTRERLTLAQQAIDAAVALQPEHADVIRAQGLFEFYAKRNYPAALGHLDRLEKSLPLGIDHFGYRGAIQRRQGLWPEALQNLRRATQNNYGTLTHLRTLENLYMELRLFVEARDLRRRVLDTLSGADPLRAGRGGRGGFAEGAAPPIPLIENRPAESYQAALIALRGFGSTEEGDALFAGLTPEQNAMPEFIALRMDWLRITNRLEESIALDRDHPTARTFDGTPAWQQAIQIAFAHAAGGNPAGARQRLAGVPDQLRVRLASEPDNASLKSWLGLAEALLGNSDAALQAGEQAVASAPAAFDAVLHGASRLRLAVIQSWIGQTEPAVNTIAELLTKPGLEATVHSMRLDPWFARLRENADFNTLLNNATHRQPLPGFGGRGGDPRGGRGNEFGGRGGTNANVRGGRGERGGPAANPNRGQ